MKYVEQKLYLAKMLSTNYIKTLEAESNKSLFVSNNKKHRKQKQITRRNKKDETRSGLCKASVEFWKDVRNLHKCIDLYEVDTSLEVFEQAKQIFGKYSNKYILSKVGDDVFISKKEG